MKKFKASTTTVPGSMKVEATARDFKIVFDEPASVGGTDSGMNPPEGLLCALGACQTIVARMFAKAQGISFEELRIDIEADMDPRGFRGEEGIRTGLQEIRTTMYFKSDESPERLQAFAEFIEKTCPVGETLAHGTKVVLNPVEVEK